MRDVRRLALLNMLAAAAGTACSGRSVGGPAVPQCPSCDDRVECTTDRCESESCENLPLQAACDGGRYCDPAQGCTSPPACTQPSDCPDPGSCATVSCDPATSTCRYADVDADGDGQFAFACGGSDCDDGDATVFAGAAERCNDRDDDCDGAEDEDFNIGLSCDGDDGDTCNEGLWICTSEAGATCTDASDDSIEVCDEADNDCDGAEDEDGVCDPNLGAWCDPSRGSGEDEVNPGCRGPTRCLDYEDGENGMCVVFRCREDNDQMGSNEDSCRLDFGNQYVCIDVQANDDTNLADNVCVPKCVPGADSNPCQGPFACTPASRRFNLKDTVCYDLACVDDTHCPVSVSDDRACRSDADCPTRPQFCFLHYDSNGDGRVDIGPCAVPGVCNHANGLCAPHSLGDPTASIGDPCQADVDCPVGGYCLTEQPYTDDLDVVHRSPRNGYCTMVGCLFAQATGTSCPSSSACYTAYFEGACMDLCDPEDPWGCRDDLDSDGDLGGNGTPCDASSGVVTNCDWYGDYECLDWGGFVWTVDSTPIVEGDDGRVCEYTSPTQRDCSDFASFGCSMLGPTGNSTDMECRDPVTGAELASGDPAGRCLDLTTSGGLCPGSFDGNGNCVP